MTARAHLAAVFALFAAGASTSACGACDDEGDDTGESGEPAGNVEHRHVRGGLDDDDSPASEECLRFCEKSKECARLGGYAIPESAEDCERSCGHGGTHRLASERAYACIDRACGEPFKQCTLRAVLAQSRQQELGLFPAICQGLCEKAAWCAERSGEPVGPGEDDCEAACRPGGAYAGVSAREHSCAMEPCGHRFRECRENGGQVPPTPPPTSP
jgi:hypothetical protein